MSKFYIYGAGGHGKVVLDAIKSQHDQCDGFIDDKPIDQWAGLPTFNISDVKKEDRIHIAIGNSMIREKISNQCASNPFQSIFHKRSVIAEGADLSEIGTLVAAGAIVGPDAKIGNHCIINHGAVIDHDCSLGNFCHIAPNAVLGGEVSIGNHVFIGAGAVVLPRVTITDHVIIGAGAIVTKNISKAGTLIGAPAKFIKE